jgi:hypothetical protein
VDLAPWRHEICADGAGFDLCGRGPGLERSPQQGDGWRGLFRHRARRPGTPQAAGPRAKAESQRTADRCGQLYNPPDQAGHLQKGSRDDKDAEGVLALRLAW